MLRRVVDLSLTVEPTPLPQWTFPPPFPEIEPTGLERSRQNVFGFAAVIPYHLGSYQDEILMDLYLGHSQPHTHVETFLHDFSTMFRDLPVEKRFSRRDVSQVPAGEFVGEAAVVDLSGYDIGNKITLEQFKEAGQHIQWGDRVLLRTGFRERNADVFNSKANDRYLREAPGLAYEIPEWLVKEKGIVLFATDGKLEPEVGEGFLINHNVFYTSGVLMMDFSRGLEQLTQKRVFLNCGIVHKHRYSEESPARAVAIEMDGPDLSKGRIVDLWSPIEITSGPKPHQPPPLYPRQEPFELKGELMKRLNFKGVQVSLASLGEESPLGREFNPRGMRDWHPYKIYSNRVGTHIEVPFMNLAGETIPAEKHIDLAGLPADRLCGPGAVVDLTRVGPRQKVSLKDIKQAGKHIRPGDIVIVRLDFSDNYYHRPDWLQYSPGFSTEAVEWLVDQGIKLLVTDSASIEEPTGYGPNPVKINHAILFKAGIPVVNCASNLWTVQKERGYVFVSPLAMECIDAAPTRVIFVEEWF